MPRKSRFGEINNNKLILILLLLGLALICFNSKSNSKFGDVQNIEVGEIINTVSVYSSPAGVIAKDLTIKDPTTIETEVKNNMSIIKNTRPYNYITYYDDGGYRVYNSITKPPLEYFPLIKKLTLSISNKPVEAIKPPPPTFKGARIEGNDNPIVGPNEKRIYSSPELAIPKNLDNADLIVNEINNDLNKYDSKYLNTFNYVNYFKNEGRYILYRSVSFPITMPGFHGRPMIITLNIPADSLTDVT